MVSLEFLLGVIVAPFDNVGGPDGVDCFFQYRPAWLRYIQQRAQDTIVKLAQEQALFSQCEYSSSGPTIDQIVQ